jgi:hypothetical protein
MSLVIDLFMSTRSSTHNHHNNNNSSSNENKEEGMDGDQEMIDAEQ